MSKSVVIIGKGPSVLKSTKDFVDSFDEVALCNFPPMEGYENYIGTRANYHFLNAHDPNPYSKNVINNLGLEYIFNTHYAPHAGIESIFPEHKVQYYPNYGEIVIPQIKAKFGFDPPCGVIAFDFFVKQGDIKKIGLVGFDFFKFGEKGYYYEPDKVQTSLKYLYSDGKHTPFNSQGIRQKESPHNSDLSKKFVDDMSEKYKINLVIPE